MKYKVIVYYDNMPDSYQSNISAIADGGVSATYFNNSALIVYKED